MSLERAFKQWHPAPWIRGRVFPKERLNIWNYEGRLSRTMLSYGLEVVNTHTGKVLVTDDSTNLSALMDECRVAVIAARLAWFYGIEQVDVT